VLLFVAFHEVLVIRDFARAEITWGSTLFYSLGAIVALVSGGLASLLIERSSRKRFQQSRVIEIQRKTIERERARADVAERSRELSEALTRLTERGPAARLQPGDVIENKYKVVSALGRGGMGEVHEVEQIEGGKHLALKVLTGKIDREALLRFAREAKIAASIDHPNVVEVVEVGVAPAGMFLVMELVAGKTLEASRSRFGDLAWALPVLKQIAEALASMHSRNIVHRDLKPGNILLDGSTPKVTDFGIASLSDAPVGPVDAEGATQMTMGDPALTRTGAILGTPLYMAPELTGGSHDAKSGADLWAFGVIAYEMLTGSHPFAEAPVLARLGGRAVPAPKPLSAKLDDDLRELIERCLSPDPFKRPSAAELARALA
jgi:serine/threonine-protein kinase